MQDPDDQRTTSVKLVSVASLEDDTSRVDSPPPTGEENAEMELEGVLEGSSFTEMEVRDAGGLHEDWEHGDEFSVADVERVDEESDLELIDRDESRRQGEFVAGVDGLDENDDDVYENFG